jgi:hypothetical protein
MPFAPVFVDRIFKRWYNILNLYRVGGDVTKQEEEKYIGTKISKSLWLRWKTALLKRGKTQEMALPELVEGFVKETETEAEDDERKD